MKINRLIVLMIILFAFINEVSSQISGTVFRDFNSNGVKDVNEPLVSGITVNAYNSTGSFCGSTISSGNIVPNYSLNGCGSSSVRVEFIIPTNGICALSGIDFSSFVGSENATSVQFVFGNSTGVNFGIHHPDDYNLGVANAKAYIPIYFNGDPLPSGGQSGLQYWFVGFPYNNSGNTNSPKQNLNGSIIGAIWGVAYSKQAGKIFTSAFLKRHVGLGKMGSGGIYMLEPTATSFNVTQFFDMDNNTFNNASSPVTRTRAASGVYGLGSSYNISSLTINYLGAIDPASGMPNGLGIIGSNSQRNLNPSLNSSSDDPAAFDQVGKVGLGDIDISDDGKFLYVTNLFQRKVFRLELNSASNPTSVINIVSIDMPTISCNNGLLRPFGLKYYRDKLYIGAVCTGENGGSNIKNGATDLYGYVFEVANPKNVVPGGVTITINYPLNYQKGVSIVGTPSSDQWYPWTNNSSDILPSIGIEISRPSPILTDIEFTERGDLVMSFLDRFGHQFGVNNSNIDGSDLFSRPLSGGDILIAGINCISSNFKLENGGSIVSINGETFSGLANLEGPGGGEFYHDEKYSSLHLETAQGAVAQLKGTNEMYLVAMDPIYAYSGGVIRLSNSNGNKNYNGYELYHDGQTGTFGKANGLGDVEFLGITPPLEIGNRVWMDTDSDGVQDADEMGLDGVTVKLFQGTTMVSTKTTTNGGQYYFNTADGLLPNTAYTIRIEAASIPSGKFVTLKDQPTGGVQDMGDNDATLVGVNADITYTTGNSGENNHTLDFGFSAALTCSSTVTAIPDTCNSTTNQYTLTGIVTFTNAPSTGTLTVQISGGGSQVFNAPFTSPQSYSIAGQTSDGASHTVTATFSADGTCTSNTTYTAPTSCNTSSCSGNLLLNPSFELDTYNTPPTNWLISPSGADGHANPNTGFINVDGTNYGIIISPSIGTTSYMYQEVNATSGNTYNLSFFMANDGPAADDFGVKLEYYDGSGNLISGSTYNGVKPNDNLINGTDPNGLRGPKTLSLGAAPSNAVKTRVSIFNKANVSSVFSGTKADGFCLTQTAGLLCTSSVTATPGICNSTTNQYTLTGQVTFTNPPSTGTLTVQITGGGSQVFNAPFTSPQSYSIAGQTSDGASHTVTATFSSDGTCTSNTTYTAPVSCSVNPCPNPNCGSVTIQKN